MAGLYDVVDALAEMGRELRATAEDAKTATEEVKRYGRAAVEADRRETRAGVTKGSKGGALGAASSRDDSESASTSSVNAAVLGAALQSLKGRMG